MSCVQKSPLLLTILKSNEYWNNVLNQTLSKQRVSSQNERILAKQLNPLLQQRKKLRADDEKSPKDLDLYTREYRSKAKDKAREYIAQNSDRLIPLGSIVAKLDLLYGNQKKNRPIWNLPWDKFTVPQLHAIQNTLDNVQVFHRMGTDRDFNKEYEVALVSDLKNMKGGQQTPSFPKSTKIADEYKKTLASTVVRKQAIKLGSYIGITDLGMRVYLLNDGINQINITNISSAFNTGGAERGNLPIGAPGREINQFSTICIGADSNFGTYNKAAMQGRMLHFAATYPDGHFAFISTINYDPINNKATGIKEIKNLFNKAPGSQQGTNPIVIEDNRKEVKYGRDFLAFIRDWFSNPNAAKFFKPVYGYDPNLNKNPSNPSTRSQSPYWKSRRYHHETKFDSGDYADHTNWTAIGEEYWSPNMPLIQFIGTNEEMGRFTMSGADMEVGTSPMYRNSYDCKYLKYPLGASGKTD